MQNVKYVAENNLNLIEYIINCKSLSNLTALPCLHWVCKSLLCTTAYVLWPRDRVCEHARGSLTCPLACVGATTSLEGLHLFGGMEILCNLIQSSFWKFLPKKVLGKRVKNVDRVASWIETGIHLNEASFTWFRCNKRSTEHFYTVTLQKPFPHAGNGSIYVKWNITGTMQQYFFPTTFKCDHYIYMLKKIFHMFIMYNFFGQTVLITINHIFEKNNAGKFFHQYTIQFLKKRFSIETKINLYMIFLSS